MIAPPAPAEPAPNESAVASPPAVALRPGVLAVALVLAWVASTLSLHVFAIFGVIPAAELLAVACLGGNGLITRLAPGRADERLLLVQTAAATATVGAALGLALPLGLAAAGDLPELAPPLLVGAALAGFVALAAVGWLFDSPLLPASAPWPAARAAAVDPATRGGRWRALSLLVGLLAGRWASGAFAAPLISAFGLAFLGNGFGLGVLGVALVLRPSLPYLLNADLDALYVPHGLMIGAGVTALAQAGLGALVSVLDPADRPSGRVQAVRTEPRLRRSLRRAVTAWVGEGAAARRLMLGVGLSLGLYLTVGFATLGFGAASEGLTPGDLLVLGSLAALLGVAFQLFSGLVASRIGFVPVLGSGLIVVALGARLGLQPIAALVLVGLILPVGPLFAELGCQLKAGALLGRDRLRGQQIIAGLLGLGVAVAVVGAASPTYFERGYVPPAGVVLATALELGQRAGGLAPLAPWVLAGVLVQWFGGAGRQVGILLATGLLIDSPAAGWALLAGLAARALLSTALRGRADRTLAIFGLGCIAAEMLHAVFGDG